MISLEVKLPDYPGSLIELIKPIAENGGNIFGILHFHDRKDNNLIPVRITFELNQELIDARLEKIQKELIAKKIKIEKITLGVSQKELIVILSGHVFDTDILDTIKRLAAKEIKTSELLARFTEISAISNVKLKLNFLESKLTEQEIFIEINKICKEKDIFLIRS